jgi:hypothetical protein
MRPSADTAVTVDVAGGSAVDTARSHANGQRDICYGPEGEENNTNTHTTTPKEALNNNLYK